MSIQESDVQSSKEFQDLKEKNDVLEKEIVSMKQHYEEELEKILKQVRYDVTNRSVGSVCVSIGCCYVRMYVCLYGFRIES